MKFGRYAFYLVFTCGLFILSLTSLNYANNPAITIISLTLLTVFCVYTTKEINKINYKSKKYLVTIFK